MKKKWINLGTDVKKYLKKHIPNDMGKCYPRYFFV